MLDLQPHGVALEMHMLQTQSDTINLNPSLG